MACSFFWGVTFVVVKNALADISVFAYLSARFMLGALPMIWIYRADLRNLTRDEAWAGIQVGLFMASGYAFQTAGIARTTPSKAAFITGVSVVLVPIFLAVFWRRKIGGWAWGGAAGSFAGALFTDGASGGIFAAQPWRYAGDGMCSVIRDADYLHRAIHRKIFARCTKLPAGYPHRSCLPLIAVPILDVTGLEHFFVRFTPQMEFGVIVTAIFTTALAYPLLVWGQSHTTATNTALILTSEPVFAALTSFVVLHERLGGRALAGAILILGGIAIAEWKGTVPSAGS